MSKYNDFRIKRNRFYNELQNAHRRVSNQTRLAAMASSSANGVARINQLDQWKVPADEMEASYTRLKEISSILCKGDDEALYYEADSIFKKYGI